MSFPPPIRHKGEVRVHAVILCVGSCLRRDTAPEEVVRLAVQHDSVANDPPLGRASVEQLVEAVIRKGPPWPD